MQSRPPCRRQEFQRQVWQQQLRDQQGFQRQMWQQQLRDRRGFQRQKWQQQLRDQRGVHQKHQRLRAQWGPLSGWMSGLRPHHRPPGGGEGAAAGEVGDPPAVDNKRGNVGEEVRGSLPAFLRLFSSGSVRGSRSKEGIRGIWMHWRRCRRAWLPGLGPSCAAAARAGRIAPSAWRDWGAPWRAGPW